MPRPVRCRRIERMPEYRSFAPDEVEVTEIVRMTVDEYEALRLLDEQGLTQEACAVRMNISRTTVTSIYNSARKKAAEAPVHGKRLLIAGGCCEFGPARHLLLQRGPVSGKCVRKKEKKHDRKGRQS